MDDQGRSVVVCDNGSKIIKYGLAQDYSPVYRFPTAVGRPKSEKSVGKIIEGVEIKAVMVGTETLKVSSVLELSHPIKNGIVENWDDATLLWEHVFDLENMRINPKRTKIFFTDSPMNSKKNREKMEEIMFEKFEFHSIFIGNQAAAALFGSGVTSGVVVEFYENVTDICPVHFYPIADLIKRFPSSENSNTSQLIFNTIQAAPEIVRKELFKKIILLGDNSSEASTIENEIKQLYLKNVLGNDDEKLKKFKIRVNKFPTENDKAFVGGTVLGNVNKDKSEFWTSMIDYKDKRSNLKY